jgi:peptidyl-prolyl cis-trans isomerase C
MSANFKLRGWRNGSAHPRQTSYEALCKARFAKRYLNREAMGLGLDKDDTIVKRRLAQKMDFLAEDLSSLGEPTVDELKIWFDKNGQRFALPGLVSFRHVYFSFDRRGENARADAAAMLGKLSDSSANPSEAQDIADPFMFQDSYGERSSEQIASISS